MPRKELEVKQEIQNIIDNDLVENLTFDAKQPRRFYTDNIFQRALAHIIARSDTGAVLLRATTAGELKVATVGAGYEHNDTKTGNAPDTYGTALAFDQQVSRIDIWIYDNPCYIKRTNDGVTYDDQIELPSGSVYNFDASTHSINIVNKSAGNVARYVIVGWY